VRSLMNFFEEGGEGRGNRFSEPFVRWEKSQEGLSSGIPFVRGAGREEGGGDFERGKGTKRRGRSGQHREL